MKCVIPEISWHNRDPVLSIDIQPKIGTEKSEFHRLASGGTDSHVLIWYLTENEAGFINLDIAADLTRHQRAVNVVRWSPSGDLLASGDDESIIFIWKLKGDNEAINILDNTNEQDKETWLTYKVLRGHMEDVYDLSWSPNSLNLISGSVDNTAMVWDVQKGKSITILQDHKSFVQGVAWDPKNQYFATLSADRYMRVFDANTYKILNRSSKCILPVPEESPLSNKTVRLFHDDTLQTFYRRLCFSPDGEILIVPAGVAELNDAKPVHTTYIYTRYCLKQPSVVLPSPDQYTVAARCCPLLFELHDYDETNPPMIALPYRMIFAVATKSSVYLYDTQQHMPFGLISNIHYTRLTDLTWSSDGNILLVSSTDGFCTLITFASNELGIIYTGKEKAVTVTDDGEMKNIEDKNELNGVSNNENKTLKNNNIDSKKEDVKKTDVNTETISKKKIANVIKATPIEIRRKPRTELEKSAQNSIKSELTTVKTPDKMKVFNLDIPQIIISSEEKFESPEIKNQPATPIQIRREPRDTSKMTPNNKCDTPKSSDQQYKKNDELTPKTNSDNEAIVKHDSTKKATSSITPKMSPALKKVVQNENSIKENTLNASNSIQNSSNSDPKTASEEKAKTNIKIKNTPPNSKPVTTKTPRNNSSKKATPIAIRRQPRNILSTPIERETTEEEALDAWPIDEPKPILNKELKKDIETISPTANGVHLMEIDLTEDIRLVFNDDSQIDELNNVPFEEAKPIITEHVTPNSKTPRRVELRTISTPKSKKKLL